MIGLRVLLILMWAGVGLYTIAVVTSHGFNLFSVALADVAAVGWAGQFDLDFVSYLMLSALWIAWRHDFSPSGVGFALAALIGGILFLSVYLLVASYQARGDVKGILLGER